MTEPQGTGISDSKKEWSLLESGQHLRHHGKEECSGACCLHGTSEYELCKRPRSWRVDRQMLEHHCEHGIGHPCRAGLDFAAIIGLVSDGVHGCDGCCEFADAVDETDDLDDTLQYLTEAVHSLQEDLSKLNRTHKYATVGDLLIYAALLAAVIILR